MRDHGTRDSRPGLPQRSHLTVGCRTLLMLIGLATFTPRVFTATAYAEVTVRATLNPQRAQVGEPITLTLDINGTQDIQAPAIKADGFDARYVGPSTQISIEIGRAHV